MARQAHHRPTDDHNIGVVHRVLRIGCCLHPTLHHKRDSGAVDSRLHHGDIQLAVSGISSYRHFPHVALCEICRERQHLTRHHAHSLRHIVKTVTAEAPQLLDIGHRIGHNHRVRRLGRCRGTYRAHRLVYRFKPRAAVQDGQQDPYAACGLWRRCRHCRHLQGSDSRTCVHP